MKFLFLERIQEKEYYIVELNIQMMVFVFVKDVMDIVEKQMGVLVLCVQLYWAIIYF
jgi:hypothetical protein